jgi:hypothetical protein
MANPNRVKSWPQYDYSWLTELPMLLSRHSGLGIGSDVLHMSAPELYGLYQFLTRLQLSQAPDVNKS